MSRLTASSVVGSEVDALTLLGVTKVYGDDVVAVDNIDLTVRDREFLTILGPSGSGKTTVLKLIAGFTAPTSGEIRIDGRDVSRTPPHRRNLGMVFQNYALFPHLTVDENLAFPLEMRRLDRTAIRRRVGEVLEIVRLPGMGKRYPRQLSGGQQQRVALARAIVYEPRVLLMDEPLGALDKRLREDLQVEFKRLHQELGVTVVYVTHDQEEALLLSDRIAIFHNGRIEQVGTGEDLYRRPRSPFVGSFIGDSNMFRGTFDTVEGASCVRRDGTCFPGTAHPDAELKPGDAAVLIVRPESCVIAPPELGPNDSERLTATIEQVIYLGSTVKYVLEFQGSRLYARLNPQHSEWRLEPGSRTVVQWSADDAVIVPGDVNGNG
ncbi:MAG: ABC transporter ATP-binding protein [Actinobacteria bacterium]|nr:ABC transporter ATP-binding protein [Actinomycetota bacterium]